MENLEHYQDCFKESLLELMNGKSILAFSKIVGIPERTINRWVNKRSTPSMEFLIKLALHFGVSIDYLVGLED